jgi:hypothetical protein
MTSHSDIDAVLEERGQTYGDFRDVARVACEVRASLMSGSRRPMNEVQAEALILIVSKLARIACGDPNYVDSWVDIAGYATLAARSILREGACKNDHATTQPI